MKNIEVMNISHREDLLLIDPQEVDPEEDVGDQTTTTQQTTPARGEWREPFRHYQDQQG